jgi:hypothetical protein
LIPALVFNILKRYLLLSSRRLFAGLLELAVPPEHNQVQKENLYKTGKMEQWKFMPIRMPARSKFACAGPYAGELEDQIR